MAFAEDDDVGNGCSRTQDVDPNSRRRCFVSQHFLPGVGTFLRRLNERHRIVDRIGRQEPTKQSNIVAKKEEHKTATNNEHRFSPEVSVSRPRWG